MILLGALVLLAGAALGFVARGLRGVPRPPSFHRLTFRRGTVWAARFAPDGQTVVYAAAWENNPIEVFLTRPESPESRSLGLKDASVLAVSSTGELAVMLDAKTTTRGYERFGTLARVPLAGGSPRPVVEDVRYADWGPDGKELMVERVVAGRNRIEYPIGKTLYESAVRLDSPRVSPEGDAVAFFEQAEAGGVTIRFVDLAGKVRTLASAKDWWNLAWSPDGRDVVYAAPEEGAAPNTASLMAVSRTGKRRLLLRFPGTLELHDVARDGRVLFGRVGLRNQVVVSTAGEKGERELSWLDGATPVGLSTDGKTILINEGSEGGGPNGSIYVRATSGSPATLVGEGRSLALSPDGRFVLAAAPATPGGLVLLPTGTGAPRKLTFEGVSADARGTFFPDGKRLLLVDAQPGRLPRTYVAGFDRGRKGTPTGVGRARASDVREPSIFRRPFRGARRRGPTERALPRRTRGRRRRSPGWKLASSRSSGGCRTGGSSTSIAAEALPAKIWKFEIATRRRELLREIAPADLAGVTSIEQVLLTPDARTLVYGYYHNLSDLYVVSNLK